VKGALISYGSRKFLEKKPVNNRLFPRGSTQVFSNLAEFFHVKFSDIFYGQDAANFIAIFDN